MRGGEKCLEALLELYPGSPVFTLFYEEAKVSETIRRHPVYSSRLQKFPKALSHYRYYLPFFPAAVESFEVGEYDLVISLSHCVAKGVKKRKDSLHICYCFTPMRYAWVSFDDTFGRRNIFLKTAARWVIEGLKKWDLESNRRVDHFIAISNHVKNRIRDVYKRDAAVVYPPVDTDFYTPDPKKAAEDFYLVVSALVPYKKIELAVEAFNRLGKRLVVIGGGPEMGGLQRKAQSNIQFLGWQTDEVLRDYYRRARALIFPGEEDFGIVPLEAQACGCPVIAFGKGGALETVIQGRTGVFFNEVSSDSLAEAVLYFEKQKFTPQEARAHAVRFGRERFKSEMKTEIDRLSASGRGGGA